MNLQNHQAPFFGKAWDEFKKFNAERLKELEIAELLKNSAKSNDESGK